MNAFAARRNCPPQLCLKVGIRQMTMRCEVFASTDSFDENFVAPLYSTIAKLHYLLKHKTGTAAGTWLKNALPPFSEHIVYEQRSEGHDYSP
jgi:hypothetical protein